jgi:hypothetical protein
MTATDGCSLFGNEKQFSKVSNKKKSLFITLNEQNCIDMEITGLFWQIDTLRINRLYNCPTPYKPPPPSNSFNHLRNLAY